MAAGSVMSELLTRSELMVLVVFGVLSASLMIDQVFLTLRVLAASALEK